MSCTQSHCGRHVVVMTYRKCDAPVDMKNNCCHYPVVLLVTCRVEVEVAAPQLLLPRARKKCVRSRNGDHFSPNPASLQKLRITSVLNRSCQTTSSADLVESSSSPAVWFQHAPRYLVFCSVLWTLWLHMQRGTPQSDVSIGVETRQDTFREAIRVYSGSPINHACPSTILISKAHTQAATDETLHSCCRCYMQLRMQQNQQQLLRPNKMPRVCIADPLSTTRYEHICTVIMATSKPIANRPKTTHRKNRSATLDGQHFWHERQVIVCRKV